VRIPRTFSAIIRHFQVKIPVMHPLIEKNRTEVAALCARHGVKRLEAFGSIMRIDFDEDTSDVDILVEFDASVASSFSNFLSLKDALEKLLGRPVDLVELKAVRNRRLRYYIERGKAAIYDAA
jgi:predicted nucleotidyltransferase